MFSRFSVKKPYTVVVGVILVLVLGVVSFTRMTTDLLPDMSLPYAIVITTDVGASPEEVEKDVTAPIEAAMATTSNIKNVSSSSYDSYSMVVLEYEQSANMDSVLIEMQQELDQLAGGFPDTVGTPIIMQIDPDMMAIMVASVDVEGMDRSQISTYVGDEMVPALESVEGVASVSLTGALKESVQVTMDEKKIAALNKKILDKIDEQFEEAQEELDEGAKEIEDGQKKLDDGKKELSGKMSSAENEILSGKIEAYVGESELKTGLMLLKTEKSIIEQAIPVLQQLYADGTALQASMDATQAAAGTNGMTEEELTELANRDPQAYAALAEQQRQLEELNSQLAQQNSQLSQMGVNLTSIQELPQVIATLTTQLAEINKNIATMESAQGQVAQGKLTVNEAFAKLKETQINSILEMSEAAAKLADASLKMEQGQAQLDSAKESAQEAADLDHILTIEMLGNLLVAQKFSMPVGYVTSDDVRYMVRVGDKLTDVEALNSVVLLDMGMDGIEPIRLSDVAVVEMVDNSADSYAKVNGNPAVMLSIEKQTGYSTGDVTGRVKAKFADMEKENGALRATVLMDQGVYIDIIVDSVLENMIVGAVLAIIILMIFLKDIRPTLVIGCSIPLSVVVAIVLMYFSDISLNIISLSGLALGIGMLVDNSIVVIENIYRFRNEGYSIRKAAVEGAGQVTGAIIASTLTTVCVFAPIIFTEGITRQLFVDIALTIAFTLLASLVVALTFVPMMAAGVLKSTKEVKQGFFDRVQDAYGVLIEKALNLKWLVFVGVVVLLVLSVIAAFSRGFTFMDMEMEADQLTVTLAPVEGEELEFEEMTALADEAVERMLTIEGVEAVGAMAGAGSSVMSMGGAAGDGVTMYLILAESRDNSMDEISAQVTEKTKDMDCVISVDSSSSDMTALMGSGISVQICGRDLDTLQDLAKQAAEIVEQTKGTVDVDDGLDDTTPSFTVRVDKEKAAEYGMTTAQVFQLVYAKLASATSPTTISTDVRDYEVYVQSEEQSEVTLEAIKKLTFTHTDREGNESEIPLTRIAEFVEGNSLNTIYRDAQTRYISVSAGVDEEHNVTLVSDEIQKKLSKIDLQEGYEIKMTGEDEMINEAMHQMYLMLILAVIFIYLVMVAQFQSFLSPFIIMFTIPLAFTGGLFALFFTGNEVSVIAMIGFVMLAGIIVNNGIVMIDYINQLRKEGMSKREAIIESGKTRLRPILMTALTTILAMSTMALGIGGGSEMMQPMAIVTEGGLIYGTLLTLVVVPCIYDAFHREKSMVEEEL